MRVPSIGQPLDERLIVREGYRLAERMMRDYQDPPSIFAIIGRWVSQVRITVLARH
ncbi:hypothetical protein [Devosia sp. 2618]|uniref:hypothetical protein n=1 Tax=Devosia sp. 2618 TaxID=3156454 RepID=UPI0033937F82